jgi:hypothetical protein
MASAQWQRETGASVAELQAQMAEAMRFIGRTDRSTNWGCAIDVKLPVLFFFKKNLDFLTSATLTTAHERSQTNLKLIW